MKSLNLWFALSGILLLVIQPVCFASADHDAPEPILSDGLVDDIIDDEGDDAVTEPTVDESEIDLVPPADKHFEDPGSFDGAHFIETFQTDPFQAKRWFKSRNSKYSTQSVSYSAGQTGNRLIGDMSIMAARPAQHYGVSTKFDQPFLAENGETVLQYEVKLENGLVCGGAYLKFLTADPKFVPSKLHDKSPFTIMFGPDKCGETNKIHFILRHQNPVSKEWEEKHMTDAPGIPADSEWHLYTLIIRSDSSFEVQLDGASKRTGSLLQDMSPPVNPDKEIDDPEDKKPADWVDEPKMPQPGATKPDDWDEDAPKEIEDAAAEKPSGWLDDAPLKVPDTTAEIPEDWDEEEDGEWEAPLVPNPECDLAPGCGQWVRPMIPNPDYKGKWEVPMVDNPDYKGEWAPRKIENPHYFEDLQPHRIAAIGGVAFEVWTMQSGILLDNIFVGSSAADAAAFAQKTYIEKRDLEAEWKVYTRRKETLTSRLKALKSGGLGGKLEYYGGMALDVVRDYLLVSSFIGLGLLVAFFYWCTRSTEREEEYVEETDSDDSEAEAAADGEQKEDAADSGGEGKEQNAADTGLRQRKKRTPKST